MSDFQSVLDMPLTEIERPKPLPVGTYLCLVNGQPVFGKAGQNQTDVVDFNLRVLQPQSDVNAEDLAAMGGIENKSIRARYWLTKEALFFLKQFLVNLGIPESTPLRQAISEAPGKQILAKTKWVPAQDQQSMISVLDTTAKV